MSLSASIENIQDFIADIEAALAAEQQNAHFPHPTVTEFSNNKMSKTKPLYLFAIKWKVERIIFNQFLVYTIFILFFH